MLTGAAVVGSVRDDALGPSYPYFLGDGRPLAGLNPQYICSDVGKYSWIPLGELNFF